MRWAMLVLSRSSGSLRRSMSIPVMDAMRSESSVFVPMGRHAAGEWDLGSMVFVVANLGPRLDLVRVLPGV